MEIKMNNDGKMEVDFSGVPDYVMDAFNNLMKKIGEWNQAQQELELLKNKHKDNKRWKPNDDERYFTIDSSGGISTSTWNEKYNYLNEIDLNRYSLNNIFKTKEEAEFELERKKVMIELEDYAREHNDEIDWDSMEEKYFICYNHHKYCVCVKFCIFIEYCNATYFSSRKIAENAIKYVGEDRIKKYCFGIEIDE